VSAAPLSQHPLTVLLVDDQPPFRLAARTLLDAEDGYVIVAEADTGEQAVDLACRLRPDLILMDIRLPGISGIEATRRILARIPSALVVLLSTHAEADLPADLLHCGAAGFIRKESLDPTALEHLLRLP
jgi:two-component system invasion response regulator UvrY